jgi:sugar transferase EpsL
MRVQRLLDVVVSASLLIVLSPLLLLIAFLVRLRLGSPVLFTQLRPGWFGKPFTILKFRTMLDARDPNGVPLPDEQRLSRFGGWLRSTSLDELPELVNVLRGEMSLVGPRPLLMEYLPVYSPAQARRHLVRPGVTGLAQVNGRNAISWEAKFELDVYYVDHRSLWLDLKILARTAQQVVTRDGITMEGYATSPWFSGSPSEEQRRSA